MTTQTAEYKHRTIHTWLDMAIKGALALPDFQRSSVWPPSKSATYLKALMENRPTGTFLILESARKPQFGSRQFSGIAAQTGQAHELVLDGQQRLTSLWKALVGGAQPRHRYYLRVADLTAGDMTVEEIVVHSSKTGLGRRFENPAVAYAHSCVPLDILFDKKEEHRFGDIWHWCNRAHGNGSAQDVQGLALDIREQMREPLLFGRELWYCNLTKDTESKVAVEIFVETNSSSAPIKRFDIVVALARGTYEEDLRNRIHDAYHSHKVMSNYFKPDQEEWIPDVGEWMLKVACLKAGMDPRESNYVEALENLAANEHFAQMGALFDDMRRTLMFVAREGSPTRRTLPSWPPLHVIAALQENAEAVRDPMKVGVWDRLVRAYYWRSLFSNRHETQANDRLSVDYQGLRRCLEEIDSTGKVKSLPDVFDEDAHPLPTEEDLVRGVQWIGTGRRGKAIAALSSRRAPSDWVTGHAFDIERIREMEDRRYLDRHHVFPRDILNRAGIDKGSIQHGLNGVLLDRRTNRRFSKLDPHDYFDRLLGDGVAKDDLKTRVESHLVPYEVMCKSGTIENRYEEYIRERAVLVQDEIKRLTTA